MKNIFYQAFIAMAFNLSVFANPGDAASASSKQIVYHTIMDKTHFKIIPNVTVTGRVTDGKGGGLAGVAVKLKGTNVGTVTNNNGTYALNIPDYNGILIFSFIGFTTREIPLNGQKIVDVELIEESRSLNDVIVVGYGVQKKVNLTGSVGTINSKDLDNRPITTSSQALTGLVTGVQVSQSSGRPGGDGAGITIRGAGSFNAGRNPLILQDGLAVSSLDDIDPDNIKSVSVLKDAAAAAIYGSRAANGVILVETKRGIPGRLQVTYNNYFGWQKLTEIPHFVNSWTYAQLTGQDAATVAKYQSGTDPDNYPNVFHLKDLLTSGSGFQTNHNISFAGGDTKTSYLFSTGYRDEDGITAKTGYKSYNFLLNVDSKLRENLALKINLSGFAKAADQPVQSGGGGIESIIGYAIREPNTFAGKKSDGTFGYQNSYSPEGWLNSLSFNNFLQKNFLGGLGLSWDIIPGLSLSGNAGYRYYNNNATTYVADVQFDPVTYYGPNSLLRQNYDGNTVTLNALLKYSKAIEKHTFTVLAGYQQETNFDENFYASRDKFSNNLLYQLDAGAATNPQNGGNASEWALQSFFGRINYDFDGKYLFEVDARYDGSSRFASKNRFGFFPAFSVGWRISEESFVKDNFTWIDQLKIRASYGSLGNQNINNNYPYQNNISLGQNYNFGGSLAPGASSIALANPQLKWETTTTGDIGLDFDLFKDRLSGTVEVYHKNTKDILYVVPVSSTLGLSPPYVNAGAVTNKGIEASVKYNIAVGKFNMSFAPNFSYNINKVTKITGDLQQDIGSGLFVGKSISPIYGYVADGLFRDAADVAGYPTQPIAGEPGVIRFKDISGPNGVPDGKVDATYDRQVIGNSQPKFSYGLTFNASYHGFDLSVLLAGLGGYQRLLQQYQAFAYFNGGNIQQWQVDNAWTEANPNPNAKYPKITNLSQGSENVQPSTYFVRDASFLKMKNAQIGYSFSSEVLKNLHISKLRVFVGGQNLFTTSHFYPGWDPEANVGAINYYPITSIYTFGLNVKF